MDKTCTSHAYTSQGVIPKCPSRPNIKPRRVLFVSYSQKVIGTVTNCIEIEKDEAQSLAININHTEKNLLKVLSYDLLNDLQETPPKVFAEDTNSVDDSDSDFEDGSHIILKHKPDISEDSKKPKGLFAEEFMFGQSEKRLNLQSKEGVKRCPFLNTLSKQNH
ncbi:unnamed protein product [Moneuplotes crassus]|uniref:Uncharacterized protein n=1 Tax=Euplotes crassus TaxID=5936 RepID=A0AAD1TZU8_EUPCR|nr:unnamed protein product [Moneuplotes crassus]